MKLEAAKLCLKNPNNHPNLIVSTYKHKYLDLHHAYFNDHKISRYANSQASHISTQNPLKILKKTNPIKEEVTQYVHPE